MPTNNNCAALQRSLNWCQGTPELPGIKRRLYYIAKSLIAQWPTLPKDAQGRPTAAKYQGSFVLVADATWKYIDILPDTQMIILRELKFQKARNVLYARYRQAW